MSIFGSQVLWGWGDWRTWAVLVLIVFVLYVARLRAHAVIRAALGVGARVFAIGGRLFGRWSKVLYARYQQGLLETRAEDVERELDRFSRALYERGSANWARYPELHQRLAARLDEIEAEYRAAAGQTLVSESATANGDAATARRVAAEVRQGFRARTRALQRIARKLGPLRRTLRAVQNLDERLDHAETRVNESFRRYAELLESDDRMAVAVGTSSLTRILVAVFFGTIAALGAALNFFLIERPMAELVGENYEVAGIPLPRAAALVLILVEAAAGFAVMEFWGVTRMIPSLDRLDRTTRRTLAILALVLLVIFALIEAGLAIVREDIVLQSEQTLQRVQGVAAQERSAFLMLLPQIVQAALGFVLPFVLALVAIPFELLFVYGRLFLLLVAASVSALFEFLFRIFSALFRGLERFLVALYDFVIFLPLWIERMVLAVRRRRAA